MGIQEHVLSPRSSPILRNHDVAIVGASCRLPGANSMDEYWNILVNGVDTIGPVPPERTYMTGNKELFAGFLKCPLDEFDAGFFNYSAHEVQFVDPQLRLYLEVTWEALENAGIKPSTLSQVTTGVYNAMGVGHYKALYEKYFDDKTRLYGFMGNEWSAFAGKLAQLLNIHGPCYTMEAACTGTGQAIYEAVSHLRNGTIDIGLVSGMNEILMRQLALPDLLYSSGCKVFDERADGFAPSEAIVTIVLKRLEDAIRDGDPVLALIKGIALNHNGTSKSLGTPNPRALTTLMNATLMDAGMESSDITYIEAHGTGTRVGDPLEAQSIVKVFSESSTPRTQPLLISSSKTNIGHTLMASGIVSLIKLLLCLKHKSVPKHIHLQNMNPSINFDSIPGIVPLSLTSWIPNSKGEPLRGMLNNFGITGLNASLILEEWISRDSGAIQTPTSNPYSIIMFSAKHPQALSSLANQYKETLISDPELKISDFAYSLLATRELGFPYRAALVVRDRTECIKKLESGSYEINSTPNEGLGQGSRDPVVFIFSGQGSIYYGMGRALYSTCSTFRKAFDHMNALFENNYGLSLRKVLWDQENEDEWESYGPGITQPALFTIQYALFKVWTDLFGIRPSIIIGHSLGEYAGAVGAGILSPQDGLSLVCQRAQLIEKIQLEETGGMMAIETSAQDIQLHIQNFLNSEENEANWIEISAQNSPVQTVVSGPIGCLRKFKEFLHPFDFKTKILNTTHAFHSRHMDSIMSEFKTVLDTVKFSSPNCKFISSVYSKEIEGGIGSDYWLKNLREPVLFAQGIEIIRQENVFIEISPQPLLLSLISDGRAEGQICCPTIRSSDPSGWKTLLSSFAKLYLYWNGKIDIDNSGLLQELKLTGRRVELPNYPFQRKKYWIQVPENGGATFDPSFSPSSLQNFHPYLGKQKNVLGSVHPYFNNNYLSSSSIPWFKDHRVSDLIVIPTACFVESCLHMGREVLGENEVLVVENIIAKKALVLEEKSKQYQTILNSNGNSIEVKGASKSTSPDSTSWTYNFTASISTDLETVHHGESLNLDFLSNVKPTDSQEFYDCANGAGLYYGPKFRQVTQFWDLETKIVGHVKNKDDGFNYNLHPCLIDGIYHTAFFYELSKLTNETDRKNNLKLWLPLQIKKLKWFGNVELGSPGSDIWITFNKNYEHAAIYNEVGTPICEFEQITVVETSRDGFEQANLPSNEVLPGFYEESWIQQFGNSTKPKLSEEDRWLIVSPTNQNHVATKVQDYLLGESGKAFICYHDDQPREFELGDSNTQFLIDFTSLSSFEALPTQIGQINGIINLFGLGKPDRDLATIATLNSIKFGLTIVTPQIQKLCLVLENVLDLGDKDLSLGSSNPDASVLLGMLKTFISEYPGVATSVINFDERSGSGQEMDYAQKIFEQLPSLGQETQFVLRDNKIYVPRLKSYPLDSLAQPDLFLLSSQKRFRVEPIPMSNNEKEFRFTEMSSWNGIGASVRIKASGLNFRDLIVYRSSLLESHGLEFGCEYCGVIEEIEESWSRSAGFKVGDKVCGFQNGNTFASHAYVTNGNRIMKIPDWMSFNEGSTLPVVFWTTWETLATIAQLSPGEKVLIHNGSGGVGLAGIQIAKYLGAEVYVTAGTVKKRNYLRKVLGLANVYDSRSTNFASEILRDTNGVGVDVVLNTLTSPGFKEASLSVLTQSPGAKGPRFIELSKLNVWTDAEVKLLRPDVQYTLYNLNADLIKEKELIELSTLFETLVLSPIPYESFPIQDLDTALRKFQSGSHIGKFVIEISHTQTLFHPENSYLITGGLGGLGLDVAGWILEQGGKNVILTGRNPPTSPQVLEKLESWGDSVKVILADISVETEVKNLLDQIPRLKGIFHAAGVFPDSLLINQSLDTFRTAYKPKVDGTWHLHNLTLGHHLDHFVVFSSIASIVGFAGQGSYTAANQFLDSFIHYRTNELGLRAGLSINYGGWSDVGIAHRSINVPDVMTKRTGIVFFSPAQGIRGLEKAIRLKLKQITIANIETDRIGKSVLPKLNAYMSKLSKFGSGAGNTKEPSANKAIANQNSNAISQTAHQIQIETDQTKRAELVSSLVVLCFRLYTGMDGDEFDSNTSTMLLGMDSLMGMEIMNRLNKELNIVLSRKRFQDSKSPAEIATYLVEVLSS